MSIKIGYASKDENGKHAGGIVGDQTGREIRIGTWYNQPWNVYLECTDSMLANRAVSIMKQICDNKGYGYDQSQRLTGYNAILRNGKRVIGAKGEFDCSSLVSACYKLAGLNIAANNTTLSLRRELLRTGKFKVYTDLKHISSDELAKPGGLYLREGSHVVMALEKGKRNNL